MSEDNRLLEYQTRLERALDAMQKMRTRLEALESRRAEPIAVIGMSCRYPGDANDPESFWKLLVNGVDAIREVPPDRWNIDALYDPDPQKHGKILSRYGGFLKAVDLFDSQFFGISPREALSMDPQQRLLLEVSWEALERAGQNPTRLKGSQTGVFVGITVNDYMKLQDARRDLEQIDAYRITGNTLNGAAGRLSYFLGLHGPSMAVDTACSSSLVAVHLACQSLRGEESNMAIAGGVNLILSPEMSISISRAGMLSPDGRCKTFDDRANGFVRSEGCGVVVLKRLSDAQANGDPILAVIRGSAVNQDGFSSGLTVPNKLAQEAVIRSALKNAGVKPHEIQYVEAHGTGTSLGDPIEVRALSAVLSEGRDVHSPFWLGSVKTNIGHAESAAGIAGLIKTVLALHHEKIPPHLHFQSPSSHIDWSTVPAVIPTDCIPWTGPYRLAGVSAFGATGTNAHVILSSTPDRNSISASKHLPLRVLTLSAKSESALGELVEHYSSFLTQHQDISLEELCSNTNASRALFNHRLALIADSKEQLREKLVGLVNKQDVRDHSIGQSSDQTKVTFLFTGQGSQYAGMSRRLYEIEPVFREALDKCARLLEPHIEQPLLDLLFSSESSGGRGARSPLDETIHTQPALFAVEYALCELWKSWGIMPSALLGHSVGEYVAACVAGVMTLEDAIQLIAARGRMMQSLPANGAMMAVFANEQQVRAEIASYGKHVSIAAINGPDSIVISGRKAEIHAIAENLKAMGIKTRALDVSHAFHSPLMDPILDEFEQVARRVQYKQPQIPLLSNLTGDFFKANEIPDAQYWRDHTRQPVRFFECMQALSKQGYQIFLEVGPNPTLLGMGKRFMEESTISWLPSLREGQDDWLVLLKSLAAMHVRGVNVDWKTFDGPTTRRYLSLPTYPFQRQRHWVTPAQGQSITQRSNLLHPLLGNRLRSATKEIIFENEWSSQSPEFLGDHVIHERVILPATAYIETLLAAGREIFKDDHLAIENLLIHSPLELSESNVVEAQTIVSERSEQEIACSVFSQSQEQEEWQNHASAIVRAHKDAPILVSLMDIQKRCNKIIAVDEHYQRMAERGLGFGPAFRGMTSLQVGKNEALARVDLTSALAPDVKSYFLHPAILDAALQAMVVLLPQGNKTYLPMSVASIKVFSRLNSAAWSLASIYEDPRSRDDILTARVSVFDDNGELLVALDGITMKQVSTNRLDSWLYEVEWQRATLAKDETAETGRENNEGSWLIFAENDLSSDHLISNLRAQHQTVQHVRRGTEFRQTPDGFEIDPKRLEDLQKLIAATEQCVGIVYAWALDRDSNSTDQQAGFCGGLLHLVQAIVSAAERIPIWVITRGTQSVTSVVTDPHASTLWGLCKVVNQEHPGLIRSIIDLDPDDAVWESANNLQKEIFASDSEDQIAYRRNERFVPRLVRANMRKASPASSEPVKLTVTERGVLENLVYKKDVRRMPALDELEIQVLATGIGFRDVLNALGMYPGGGELGSECAGVVTAVGSRVENICVGDPVIAVASGSFASYAYTRAHNVVRKPDHLTFAEAATIPSAFLTTQYALHQLAGMKSGDRVLIHAAAGGVGLAAVQLAQQAGAEIFATAGSESKRAMLKSLGIQHIMDSRKGDFAEEIMSLTNSRGMDIVLNSLADDFIAKSISVLAENGWFLELGKRGIWNHEQFTQVRPNGNYAIIDLLQEAHQDQGLIPQLFERIMPCFQDGTLKPLPLRVFRSDEVIDAFRNMAMGLHTGKLVIVRDPVSFVIHPQATYLITGGSGGLGREVAGWLASEGARHIVLVGRHAPSEMSQTLLKKLTESGVELKIIQADVSKFESIAAVFNQIEKEMPPLKGIVHAAGVIDDGIFIQQTWERFAGVFAPKVQGGWNLHELTRGMALDFFVLFSSASSLIGSRGQANYVSANTFLDMLAYYRRGQGLPGLSIGWGPWEQVGVAAQGDILKRMRDYGIESFPPEQGVSSLSKVMKSSYLTHVAVMPINWDRFTRNAVSPFFTEIKRQSGTRKLNAPAGLDSPEPDNELWKRLKDVPESKRKNLLQSHIQLQALKVLSLPVDFPLEQRQPLQELGLDSLMAVELRNLLSRSLPQARELPATLVFDYPTLEALTQYFLDALFNKDKAREDILKPAERMKSIILSEISDEEAQALLLAELDELQSRKNRKP